VATTRTGEELIDDLIDLADLEDMEVRHPRARLLRYISVSLAAVRAELTAAGFSGLLDWTDPAALPTSPPVAGENFLEVDWPASAVSIHGIDVNTSGTTGRWYPLDTMVMAERRDFYSGQGVPRAWILRSVPKEQAAGGASLATTSGKLNIYPASTLGLYYRILYLPAFPGITSESHVVQGFDGDWIQWALWNAAIMVLFKDDEMDPSQDQKAVRERELVKARVLTNINRTNRAAPIQPTRAGGIRIRRF
jgi:hypothetical protein